jgi:hypothetical protein
MGQRPDARQDLPLVSGVGGDVPQVLDEPLKRVRVFLHGSLRLLKGIPAEAELMFLLYPTLAQADLQASFSGQIH